MPENGTMRTWIDGREVDVPATRPDVRAALPEGRRADFDREMNAATVLTIHHVLRRWMLEAAPDPAADAALDRLAAEEAERRGGRVSYRIAYATPADEGRTPAAR
ncbi:hypothetical protein [Streptomyces sp. GSL17-111]|uniref:hypothetical protein n=1 Tax=Streptomyces sp. GSL17-111 TaxID=3121596 RepID=UPI0030F4B23C